MTSRLDQSNSTDYCGTASTFSEHLLIFDPRLSPTLSTSSCSLQLYYGSKGLVEKTGLKSAPKQHPNNVQQTGCTDNSNHGNGVWCDMWLSPLSYGSKHTVRSYTSPQVALLPLPKADINTHSVLGSKTRAPQTHLLNAIKRGLSTEPEAIEQQTQPVRGYRPPYSHYLSGSRRNLDSHVKPPLINPTPWRFEVFFFGGSSGLNLSPQ